MNTNLITRSLLVALALTLTLVSVVGAAAAPLYSGKAFDAPAAAGNVILYIAASEDGATGTAKMATADQPAAGVAADFLAGRNTWYVGLSPNAQFGAGILADGSVVRVNMASGEEKVVGQAGIPQSFEDRIANRLMSIANDGSMVMTGSGNKLMYVSAQGVATEIAPSVKGTPAISADGKSAAFVSAEGKLFVWKNGAIAEVLPGTGFVVSPAISADGSKVAVATESAAYGGAQWDPQIVQIVLADSSVTKVTSSGSNWYPVYGPDGSIFYMAYTSDTQANVMGWDGTNAVNFGVGDGVAAATVNAVVFHQTGVGILTSPR